MVIDPEGATVAFVYLGDTPDRLESIPDRPHRKGWFAEAHPGLEHPTRGHAAVYAIRELDRTLAGAESEDLEVIVAHAPTPTWAGTPRVTTRGRDSQALVRACARAVARGGAVVLARLVRPSDGCVLFELDGRTFQSRGPLSPSRRPVVGPGTWRPASGAPADGPAEAPTEAPAAGPTEPGPAPGVQLDLFALT